MSVKDCYSKVLLTKAPRLNDSAVLGFCSEWWVQDSQEGTSTCPDAKSFGPSEQCGRPVHNKDMEGGLITKRQRPAVVDMEMNEGMSRVEGGWSRKPAQ